MTLSRRFYRHTPMTLVLAIATASGCASSGQLAAGRLPYNENTARGVAARNPFPAETGTAPAAPQRPSLRPGVTGPQPPAMAQTTWERPAATPSSIPAQPPTQMPPAGGQPLPGATAMASPNYAAPTATMPPATMPPASATHQTAYYEQPASAAGYPPPSSGTVQQMDYSTAISNDNPFAAVEGATATGTPIQYTVPPTTRPPVAPNSTPLTTSAPPTTAAPPTMTAPTTAPSSTPAPFEWGATTASEAFLPPIRQ